MYQVKVDNNGLSPFFAFFAALDLRNDLTFCELWRKMNFNTALFCVDDIENNGLSPFLPT